ncbi:MAG: hypothetical protein WA867_05475 [Candidatus Acidiferrales bacterium]
MMAIDLRTANVMKGTGLFLLYAFFFWFTFKRGRGNRVIQCGCITLMLLLVIVELMRIPNFRVAYAAWLAFALLLLCMLTLVFLFQQGYHALRDRKIHKHSEASASDTAATSADERYLTK